MNTPARIARMLGWPEAQARLRVWRHAPGWWTWAIDGAGGCGTGRTHAEALAVGLAALETASMRNRT